MTDAATAPAAPMDPELAAQLATLAPFAAEGFAAGVMKLAAAARADGKEVLLIPVGVCNLLIMCTPAAIHEVYGKQGAIWNDRPDTPVWHLVRDGPDGLNTRSAGSSNGETWRKFRKLLVSQLLSAPKMPMYVPIMHSEILTTLNAWAACGPSSLVTVRSHLHRMVTHTIVRLCVGHDIKADDPIMDAFIHKVEKLLTALGAGSPTEFIPALRPMMPDFHMQAQEDLNFMLATMSDWFQERKRLYIAGERTGAFAEQLLELQAEEEATDDQLVVSLTEAVATGEDTSSGTAEWLLLQLANHPEWQEVLRTEALAVLGPDGVYAPDKMLPKHTAFVNETLRGGNPMTSALMPTAVPRSASEDTEVMGVKCPRGTLSIAAAAFMWTDAENVGANPLEFDPTRFLPPHSMPAHTGGGAEAKFSPFGVGRRMCPGWRLAMTMEMTLLSEVVRRFRVVRPSDDLLPAARAPVLIGVPVTPVQVYLQPLTA